jgi:hypothetical protein
LRHGDPRAEARGQSERNNVESSDFQIYGPFPDAAVRSMRVSSCRASEF